MVLSHIVKLQKTRIQNPTNKIVNMKTDAILQLLLPVNFVVLQIVSFYQILHQLSASQIRSCSSPTLEKKLFQI